MTSFGRTLANHRLRDYGVPLLAVGIAVVAGAFTLRAGAAPLAAAPLGLAVAVSAWYGGFGPGLFALALAAAGADVFLIEPGSVMQFASAAEGVAFAFFVAGWLVFCILAERVYRQGQHDREVRTTAENSSSQANRLAQLTAALAQARTPRAA